MATYVPNATQTSEPVDSRTVESAALEFRTLKTRVNSLETAVNTEDTRDLRVPEAAIAAVPAIASRAGKVLGFDAAGDPVVVEVSGATDPSLRADLAASSGASLIGYMPTGVGAVATDVQSKLRQSVSVLDFGAIPATSIGTGSIPASVAIQAALDYMATLGGGDVTLDGAYLIDDTITVPAQVTLIGTLGHYRQLEFSWSDRTDGTLYITSPGMAAKPAIILNAYSSVRGVSVFNGSNGAANAIKVSGVNARVNNFLCNRMKEHGIVVEATQFHLFDSFIAGSGFCNVYAANSFATDCRFVNCEFQNPNALGAANTYSNLYLSGNPQVMNCRIGDDAQLGKHGIESVSGGLICTGIQFLNNARAGLYINGSIMTVSGCSFVVSSSVAAATNARGIVIATGSSGIVVSGCTFNCASNSVTAIEVLGAVSKISLSGLAFFGAWEDNPILGYANLRETEVSGCTQGKQLRTIRSGSAVIENPAETWVLVKYTFAQVRAELRNSADTIIIATKAAPVRADGIVAASALGSSVAWSNGIYTLALICVASATAFPAGSTVFTSDAGGSNKVSLGTVVWADRTGHVIQVSGVNVDSTSRSRFKGAAVAGAVPGDLPEVLSSYDGTQAYNYGFHVWIPTTRNYGAIQWTAFFGPDEGQSPY